MKVDQIILEAAGRLVPDLIRSLTEGVSEDELRARLRANRERIESSYDEARERIEATREEEP